MGIFGSSSIGSREKKSIYTGLGVGHVRQPSWISAFAPHEFNVVWLMIVGARKNGVPLFSIRRFLTPLVIFGLLLMRGSWNLCIMIVILTALDPIFNFNKMLRENGQLTELRMLPLTSYDYYSAIRRYVLLVLVPGMTLMGLVYMFGYMMYQTEFRYGYWYYHVYGALLIAGIGLVWQVIWGILSDRPTAKLLIGSWMLAVILLPVLYGANIGDPEKWIPRGFLIVGIASAIRGEFDRRWVRRNYVEKVLPKLHNYKKALVKS